ncbi:MAG: nitroreductase family protein [Gemmatimonadetes bacterium]|nr:nitroreductase family protein [Gemmatimonadota bacterium]
MPARFEPHREYRRLPEDEMLRRADAFLADIRRRRTVREFAPAPVPAAVIDRCLLAAGTAPNGANRQPWHFVVVTDPEARRRIREAAEKEEHEFYTKRAPPEWLEALEPLGTGPEKPFLEDAPVLIAIFCKSWERLPDGRKAKNYYVTESVGIATGILITALHQCGLATLTHTPSPMGFLNDVLGRPPNERPFLLLVVGYPAENATVPVITRKPLGEIATFVDGKGEREGESGLPSD